MTATAAEALELALWLNRAPAHRNALLGRPLPEGIGQLLRVATGADDAVAAASRITGEPPQVVLEAVRFYLQQVLFHEDADAYRVLGLRSDASQAQAREHHRLQLLLRLLRRRSGRMTAPPPTAVACRDAGRSGPAGRRIRPGRQW